MYADDTNVTFSAPSIPDLELQINTELKHIDLWLKANNLSLNVAKTESCWVVSMHTEVMICKGLIEPRFDYCKAVWGGLCYRGAYLWNNLPEDVRTHSKFSRSDDFEGKFSLGLLIMLPHGNHVKQFIELIHFLLLYEYFNRL